MCFLLRMWSGYVRNRAVRAIFLAVSVWVIALFSGPAQSQERPLGGNQALVVYDGSNRPVRRIANISLSTSCANSSDTLFALAESRSKTLLLADQTGAVVRSIELHWPISQVFGDKEGFIVVHTDGHVSDVGVDGVRKSLLAGRQITSAVRGPNGGVIGVTSFGGIGEWTWSGQQVAHYDSEVAGRQVSLKGVALGDSSSFVTIDTVARELVVLDLSLRETRRIPVGLGDFGVFQSIGSSIVLSERDSQVVHFVRLDGTKVSLRAPVSPFCAGSLSGGTFYLGYTSKDAVSIPTGVYLRDQNSGPRFTPTCLAAVVLGSLLFGLLSGYAAQRFPKRRAIPCDDRKTSDEPGAGGESCTQDRSVSAAGLCLLALALAGLYLSYWVMPNVRGNGALSDWSYYVVGALLAAGSLALLARQTRAASWIQPPSVTREPWKGNRVVWSLLLGAVVAGALANYFNWQGDRPKLVVALWIVSQVWFVMAFLSSASRITWSRQEWIHLCVLGGVGLAARLVKMGECPGDISFDFGIAADAAYRSIVEEWNPLFILDAGQTIGRVWGLQLGLAIWGLGLHEWVLCVPSLIWALGCIFASYLLGRELISHRFGLIFALLVSLQHNFLSYSRLPYVTESTAPFVFCLYFLVRGVKGCRFRDWALAGLWASVSMMTVRQFTTFPFIGLVIFLFMCVFHWRVMWRFRYHLLILLGGCLVTFSPWDKFYLSSQQLAYRLSGTSPLLWGYKVNPNIDVWISQFDRAFGGILRYPDRISWPSEALAPICLALTGSLFGCGLVYLLVRWRSLSAPTALIPMAVSITLGSAFLDNPPSYYHQFVGIVFVMFVVAVPLECMFQGACDLRWRWLRWLASLGVLTLVVASCYEQVSPLLRYCAAVVNAKGEVVPNYSFQSFFSRYMLDHHDRRFVGFATAQEPFEWGHSNISIFYGQFSERHEVYSPVSAYLPLRSSAQPHDVDFIFRGESSERLATVRKVYPNGTLSRELAAYGQVELTIYTVPSAEISRVYERSIASGEGFDRDYFSLAPLT